MNAAWPHAPTHCLADAGTFIVTAATYQKAHHFRGADRLALVQRGLLKLTAEYGWDLEAWAIFSNHYHFIAHSPATPNTLPDMLATLHKKLATWVNKLDQTKNRKVWHNYWDTRLTHHTSYLARLKYVHHNAVRHGLVQLASHYPWCSASWFEQLATPATVRAIYSFQTDRITLPDNFQVAPEW